MSQMGWIKLHRSLMNWEWYGSPKHLAVFMDLLLNANHKKNKYRGITLDRGQLSTSYKAISERSGVSYQSVRTVLADLQSTQEVTHKNMGNCSIISILKWDDYQVDNILSNNKVTSDQQATNRQLTTNKNDNNEKNEKNVSFDAKDLEPFLFDNIQDAWNMICPGHGKLKHARAFKTDSRHKFVEIVKANPDLRKLDTWKECFERVKNNELLSGRKQDSGFVCSLNWLIDKESIVDVLNGQYGGNNDVSGLFDWMDKTDDNENKVAVNE